MNWTYVAIPIVTALIGWGTNVVAVKMLFLPRKPLRLGVASLHGVIPKRRDAMAVSMAEIFEAELLSNDELAEKMKQVDLSGAAGDLISAIKSKIPLAGMFLKGSIEETLKKELEKEIPALQGRYASAVTKQVDLRNLIEEKIRGFSLLKMEEIIMRVASRELKSIELLGGLLGLLIGLAQVGLMALFSHG